MKQVTLILLLLLLPVLAKRMEAPIGWGDFQMGLVNNGRTHWEEPMKAALNEPSSKYHINRKYAYIADTNDVKSYWGRDGGAIKNGSSKILMNICYIRVQGEL